MTTSIFKPRARLLMQLGEQLIRSESVALLELVKNSYDADATFSRVRMADIDDPKKAEISIRDDGFGMDVATVRDVWMEPGSDYKEKIVRANKRTPRFKRLPLGEKGIGRFGAHKLGDTIELVTRKQNCSEVCLKIDWKTFQTAKYLEDVPVRIVEREPVVFKGNSTGTLITVKNLRSEWDRGMVREIHRSITALCSPFDFEDSFSPELICSKTEWLDDLFTWEQAKDYSLFKVSCTIEKDQITKFLYKFMPWDSMRKLSPRKITETDREVSKNVRMVRKDLSPIDISRHGIGKIKFKALIFDRDSKVLALGMQDKSGFKEYLDLNGGIRVYRDGVRVYDYGEPGNDWLSLGVRRVNVPSKRVSNNIIVGAVILERETSKELVEKTNREGFIENKAYESMRDAVLYTLDLVETFRNIDKDKIRTFYGPTPKSEPVISTINDLRVLVEKRVKETELRKQLSSYIQRIETDYRYINETLLKSAGAGLSLSVVIHEADKILVELSHVVKKERPSQRIVDLIKRLSQLLEGYSLIIRNKGKEKNDIRELVSQSIFNVEFRLEAHDVKIIRNYEKFASTVSVNCATNLVVGSIINIIDNAIWWLEYGRVKGKKIYVSLAREPKGFLSLIIADNGPGFSMPTEELARPFVSTKPGGMGLGLHIVREVMEAHGGKLSFPENGEFNLPAEFKGGATVALSFPLNEAV